MYEVNIDHLGDYASEDLPQTVTLEPGREVEIDIRIYEEER
jgi:hypothetical protein